jgi:hypothetical protein
VKVHTGCWWGDLSEGDYSEDPGIDGRIILRWFCMKWDRGEGMDWIDLAQDKKNSWALVNGIINL